MLEATELNNLAFTNVRCNNLNSTNQSGWGGGGHSVPDNHFRIFTLKALMAGVFFLC